MVGEGGGQRAPTWSEIADFEPLIARSTSAATSSEKKVQLTLIGIQFNSILF